MDAGGAEGPIPEELLKHVTVLSPNESELARLTAMPTNSLEKILLAAAKVQEMVRLHGCLVVYSHSSCNNVEFSLVFFLFTS